MEMKREKVGQVTMEEKDQIQRLYNRKNALREMIMVLQENANNSGKVDDVMYEKVMSDIDETQTRFQGWWDQMGMKYQWCGVENGRWSIDFNTGEIFLEYPQAS